MSLSVNFTNSQSYGSPSNLSFLDISTGSDVLVTGRRIYLIDENGNYIVESGVVTNYNLWAGFPGTTSITLDLFLSDKAFSGRVDWVNSGGAVLYTKPILSHSPMYAKDYYIFLIKSQQSNRKLQSHANFWPNTLRLIGEIKFAYDSINLMSDISACQSSLDRAADLINNPSNFF